MSARLLTTADAAEWEQALPASRSAFGSLGFARAQERMGLANPRLLVAMMGEAAVAYPLSLRSLDDLPFAAAASGRWDSASPPFTGPIASGGDLSRPERLNPSLGALAEQVAAVLSEEGVVSEFAHLHPWSSAPDVVGGGEADREVVWVDATLDPEELWRSSYSKACRKNVRRSEREGVGVRAAEGPDDIAEFHRIYEQTMVRSKAQASYFLDLGYFEAIHEEMPDAARFALAEVDGKVIAATLYMHDADDVYSYLGGADHAFQELRPTNAVVHATIAWAREEGKRRLILGGGYRPGDGIFRFKASFSPKRVTLRLARRVLRPDDYEALVEAWARHHGGASPTGFFPAYRDGRD